MPSYTSDYTFRNILLSASWTATDVGFSLAPDLNLDGYSDLIITGASYPPNGNVAQPGLILTGDGQGNFTPISSSTFPLSALVNVHARDIVTADFNGDGKPDIFIASHGYDTSPFPGEQNQLYLSQSTGWVSATSTLPQRLDYSHSVAVGDVNGDGKLDLYVGNINGQQNIAPYILLNDGTGHFTIDSGALPTGTGQILSLSKNVYTSSLFADLNNDGKADLILGLDGSSTSSGGSLVLWNTGSGYDNSHVATLPAGSLPNSNRITLSLAALDINQDGLQDIVTLSTQNSPYYTGVAIDIYINQGNGTFANETTTVLGSSGLNTSGGWSAFLYPMDVNGDGTMDLVLSNYSGAGATATDPIILLNDGQGHFQTVTLEDLTASEQAVMYGLMPIQTSKGLSFITTYSQNGALYGNELLATSAIPKLSSSILGTSQNDTLTGTANGDHLYGLAGDDTISGGAGNDYLSGGVGNDSLIGGAGADFLDGGAGTDTAVIASMEAAATVTVDGNGYIIVANSTQTETLTNIEQLQLTDGTVSTANASVIADGYESFFGRAPSASELGVWANLLATGTTVASFDKTLANAAGTSADAALVKFLYDGYFGRDPSAAESTYWTGALQSGAQTLANFNSILANDGSGKAFSYQSIKGLYDVFLGRDPGAAEVSYWSGALQSGSYDLRGFELVLAAQSGVAANEAASITQAYQTWLGRAPTTSDLSYWTGQFNNGTINPLQLRQALVNDASGQAHIASVITADYTADFGRAATAAEITTWKGLIGNGASFTTLTSALLGDGSGATAKTVTSAYDSYFGRDPTASELGVWRGLLANGSTTATLHSALVNDASGQAHTTSEIGNLYQTYFGRAPTTSETNVWKGLVTNSGDTFSQLHDALTGDSSGKAYAVAEISPLYQAIEGRAPAASDTTYWTNAFNAGTSNLDKFIDVLLHDGGSTIATTTLASGHAAVTFVDPMEMLVINGFGAGDQIDFQGSAFNGYNPLDHAVQVGADVLIYGPDATHVVLLENEQLSSLTGANFLHV